MGEDVISFKLIKEYINFSLRSFVMPAIPLALFLYIDTYAE